MALIFGENDSQDTIDGTSFRDLIFGGSPLFPFTHTGEDRIDGQDDNDAIFGGDDDDDLDGSDGNDFLAGGRGFDVLTGHDDDDLLRGGFRADSIDGGNGRDLIRGMQGFDAGSGGDGNDIVFGGFGRDTSTGGTGDDLLFIVLDENTLKFSDNDGDDTVVGYKPGIDHFDLTDVSGLSSFNDLTLTDQGDDVLVDYGSGTFLLKNTDLGSVDAGDFTV